MKTFKKASFLESIQFDQNKIQTNLILETDYSKEVRIVMSKDQVMKEHQTAYPIAIHLLKGIIELGINQEKNTLNEGDMIALDANVPHDLTAIENSIIRLTLSKHDQIQRVEKIISLS